MKTKVVFKTMEINYFSNLIGQERKIPFFFFFSGTVMIGSDVQNVC